MDNQITLRTCELKMGNSIPSRRLFTSTTTANVNKNVRFPRLAYTRALRILINHPIKDCSIHGIDWLAIKQPVYTYPTRKVGNIIDKVICWNIEFL